MLSTLVWVTAGRCAGKFVYLSAEGAQRTVDDGFGQVVRGSTALARLQKGPHEMADRFFAARDGYTTRELKAGQPPAIPPPDPAAGPGPMLDMPPEPPEPPEAGIAPTPAKATKPKTKKG